MFSTVSLDATLAFGPNVTVAADLSPTGSPALTRVDSTGLERRCCQSPDRIWAKLERIMTASFALRHVCHTTFEELAQAGYSIQSIDDGATPLQMNESILHGALDDWMRPEPIIVPKVAILEGATLFRDGSALLPDGLYCNYDPGFCVAEPWRERYRQHNLSVMHFIDRKYNDALIKPPPRSMAVEGRCFAALHNCSNNYGHFLHDVLSRIYYEDLGLIAPGREKIIAPRSGFPMARKLFKKVFADYEIVPFPFESSLEIEELVLPANLCSSTRFNPACIAALKNRMQKIMDPFAGSDRHKILVSRRDGLNQEMGRNFANAELFEARMEKSGYKVVESSKLDAESQFSLWANATEIIGVHGAGLMNLLMIFPGSGFTEITGSPHAHYGPVQTPKYTARCALAFGHKVNVIASTLDPKGCPRIDLERLDIFLSEE